MHEHNSSREEKRACTKKCVYRPKKRKNLMSSNLMSQPCQTITTGPEQQLLFKYVAKKKERERGGQISL